MLKNFGFKFITKRILSNVRKRNEDFVEKFKTLIRF